MAFAESSCASDVRLVVTGFGCLCSPTGVFDLVFLCLQILGLCGGLTCLRIAFSLR